MVNYRIACAKVVARKLIRDSNPVGDSDCPSGPNPDKAKMISTLCGPYREFPKEFSKSFGGYFAGRADLGQMACAQWSSSGEGGRSVYPVAPATHSDHALFTRFLTSTIFSNTVWGLGFDGMSGFPNKRARASKTTR
jgi:hypothetical protein